MGNEDVLVGTVGGNNLGIHWGQGNLMNLSVYLIPLLALLYMLLVRTRSFEFDSRQGRVLVCHSSSNFPGSSLLNIFCR